MKTERELFLYELEGRGYTFENTTWLGNCFEDNFIESAMFSSVARGDMPCEIYKAMIGTSE